MFCRRSVVSVAILPALRAASARAESGPPSLSPAQVALFETPHLAALRPPLRLDYAFRREEAGRPAVEDSIRLEVRAGPAPGRHGVAVEFLTGPRAIRYPPAPEFRGNPLLLFALDRETRELSAATGGSTTWFRNRIRRALADAAELHPAAVVLGDGRRLPATEIRLTPFAGEPRARRYQAMRFTFLLSEAVPGQIHTIRTDLPEGEGGGAVMEEIVFAGTAPLEEAPR
jgi:hypothetical protein